MRTMSDNERAQAMADLREKALMRGDAESLWVARLMADALASSTHSCPDAPRRD